jgi:hypothetical protein
MEDMWKETNHKLTSATTSAVSWKVQEKPQKIFVQSIRRLIMQSSPVTCYFLPLRPIYFPQHPILKHP